MPQTLKTLAKVVNDSLAGFSARARRTPGKYPKRRYWSMYVYDDKTFTVVLTSDTAGGSIMGPESVNAIDAGLWVAQKLQEQNEKKRD